MSNSRRTFLRFGLMAAAVAAVPGQKLFGQGKGILGVPGAQTPNGLKNYSKATFLTYVNSVFELESPSGTVEVVLQQVDDLPSSKAGEAFSLLFRGGSKRLRQDVYRMRHGALGTFDLFLVPASADANGAQGYVATLNRLSYTESMNNTPPERVYSPGTKGTVLPEVDGLSHGRYHFDSPSARSATVSIPLAATPTSGSVTSSKSRVKRANTNRKAKSVRQ